MRKPSLVSLVLFSAAAFWTFAPSTLGQHDLPEKDEINQTVQLNPGAEVRVSDISGPVEIETVAGSSAEIHIVRSARTRSDLDRRKIVVEHSPARLVVRTESESGRWSQNEVRQRVLLKIPRNVKLNVDDVSGSVNVGELDGPVRINDVSGKVEVAQAAEQSSISDVSGSVVLTVVRLAEGGIRINDVSGKVEIRVGGDVNADINVTDVSGNIQVDIPNVTVSGKIDSSTFRGRVGSGGTPITVSDVSGSVKLRRS